MTEESKAGPLSPQIRAMVGKRIAYLRRLTGLTGGRLAGRVGMSQARISRIENGRAPVTLGELESLATALDLPPEETHRLLTLAARGAYPPPARHLGEDDVAERQGEIQRIESSTKELRVFALTAIPGLLQTSEYARALLATLHALTAAGGGEVDDDVVLRSVATRLDRQTVLADPERRFHLVMQEAALRNRICPPAAMLAQIQRIREVLEHRENLTVAIVPLDSHWPQAAPTFTIYDDSHVLVDLPHTPVVVNDPEEVMLYRRLFDRIEESSTTDVDPILDGYVDMYYDLARPRRD